MENIFSPLIVSLICANIFAKFHDHWINGSKIRQAGIFTFLNDIIKFWL